MAKTRQEIVIPGQMRFQRLFDDSIVDFRKARPQALEFAAKFAAGVSHYLTGANKPYVFYTFSEIYKIARKVDGEGRRFANVTLGISAPDSPKYMDFAGMVFEIAHIGCINDGTGIWFFKLDRDTRSRMSLVGMADYIRSIEPDTKVIVQNLTNDPFGDEDDDGEDEDLEITHGAIKAVD